MCHQKIKVFLVGGMFVQHLYKASFFAFLEGVSDMPWGRFLVGGIFVQHPQMIVTDLRGYRAEGCQLKVFGVGNVS